MQLTGADAESTLQLVTGDLDILAQEHRCPQAQIRAMQHYIVMVAVIAMRKRRGIPYEALQQRAKLLQRCMSGGVKKILCDKVRFAI